MARRKKSDAELRASGSANLSRRTAAKERAAEAAATAAQIASAPKAERPPLPRTTAEWHALIRLLPGFDPFALAGACRFDERVAARAIDWIETNIRHSKGAKGGALFVMQPWQRAFVANLFGWVRPDGTRRFREALLYVGKKQGKALDVDTPIPTPRGWTRMGDLVAGDWVYDEHGAPCAVVAGGDVEHDRPCYRVSFDDGTSIVADAEHEWYTDAYLTGRPGPQRGVPREQTKQTHADHIRTTEQIRNTLRFRCGGPAGDAANHSIPVAGPLRGRPRDLPIKPYTLGAWLGDGTSASAQLTCADVDFGIVREIEADGYDVGPAKYYKPKSPTTATVAITPGVRGKRGTSVMRNALRALGLLGNKHIPAAYLRASAQQRTALLQGLMDTDGCVSDRGQCEFTTTSPALRDGVAELLRSLGYKPNVGEGRARVNGRDVGAKWRIRFHAYSDRPCFRLARKATRLRPPPTYRARSMRRQIVAVDPVPSRPVRCIQVDSPSHLYLAGPGMVPTHNSAMVSSIACYLALEDGEKGPEVYCAAAKRDQAKIIWQECVTQLKRIDPDEQRAQRFQHSVTLEGGGFLKPISADAGTEDGMNPSAALIDELHRQPNANLVNVIRFSTAARAQPLVIMLTTADEDRPSVCNDTLARAKDVRDNPGDPARPGFDPEFLPAIYEADPKDDWTSPETWRKANPNLGVTVSEEFLAKGCREAKENPTLRADFLRYHLNVRVNSAQSFFDPADWDACVGPESFQQLRARLRGKRCFGGLDLAAVNDLASLALWFPDELAVLWWTWCPRDGARDRERNDRVPYLVWAGQGALILTGDGPVERTVSYGRIRRDILQVTKDYQVVEIGFDKAGANETVTALRDEHGIRFLDFQQGFAAMSNPMREVQRLMTSRGFVHGGDPVARWAMLNVVPKHGDVGDYIMPSKKRSPERIDPAVALIMAVGVGMLQPAPVKKAPVAGSVSIGRRPWGEDD